MASCVATSVQNVLRHEGAQLYGSLAAEIAPRLAVAPEASVAEGVRIPKGRDSGRRSRRIQREPCAERLHGA